MTLKILRAYQREVQKVDTDPGRAMLGGWSIRFPTFRMDKNVDP